MSSEVDFELARYLLKKRRETLDARLDRHHKEGAQIEIEMQRLAEREQALDTVQEMLEENNAETIEDGDTLVAMGVIEPQSFTAAVKHTISTLVGEFTVPMIEAMLKGGNIKMPLQPRVRIAMIVAHETKAGRLQCVKPGRGPFPATYKHGDDLM